MTALDLIKSSLRLIGVLASGETPTAAESADALVILNNMIESFSNEGLMIYETSRDEHTLTAAQNPHTIGSSGGNITADRPLEIYRASIITTDSDVEYPIDVFKSEREWQEVSDKTIESTIPYYLWYEREFPLGKTWLYPVPSESGTLVLYTPKALSTLAGSATEISLPLGYERMLRYNLALDLGPEYGKSVPQSVIDIAKESKAAVKRTNKKVRYLKCDPAVVSGGHYNIRTGRNE